MEENQNSCKPIGSLPFPHSMSKDDVNTPPHDEGSNKIILMLHDEERANPPQDNPLYNDISERLYDYEHASEEGELELDEMKKRFASNPDMFPRSYKGVKRKRNFFPTKGKPMAVSYKTIFEIYNSLKDNRWKMFFLCAYLTGGRVSEVLGVRRVDIKKEYDEKYGDYLEITLLTEKKQGGITATSTRDIRLYYKIENQFCSDLWNYVNLSFGGNEFIFPQMDRIRCWRFLRKINFGAVRVIMKINNKKEIVLKENFKGYPHYLRHCRLTHLASVYKFPMPVLVYYAGWSGMAMASVYVHTEKEQIGNSFFNSSSPAL